MIFLVACSEANHEEGYQEVETYAVEIIPNVEQAIMLSNEWLENGKR